MARRKAAAPPGTNAAIHATPNAEGLVVNLTIKGRPSEAIARNVARWAGVAIADLVLESREGCKAGARSKRLQSAALATFMSEPDPLGPTRITIRAPRFKVVDA